MRGGAGGRRAPGAGSPRRRPRRLRAPGPRRGTRAPGCGCEYRGEERRGWGREGAAESRGGRWARLRCLSDPIALRCGCRSHPPKLPAASSARLLENSVPLAAAAPRSRSVGGTWRGAAVPPRHLSVPFQKAFPIAVWLRRDRPSPRTIPLLVGGWRCWKFQRGPRDNGNELRAAPGGAGGGFGDPAGAQLQARRAPGECRAGEG